VKQSKSDAVLYILSDGACRKELEQMTRDLNLTDVHFIGRVPNAQVYEYLDKADVFVSMPKIDNQPMSILEAFKCGLLVISSCVGGVPYMVDNGRTGILVESNNHVQLARKMLDAMDNPHKTIEMMQAGHEELRKYRWEYIKEKLYALYLGN
jgi:glycosyltransferase involved in cell wall biosynthesis